MANPELPEPRPEELFPPGPGVPIIGSQRIVVTLEPAGRLNVAWPPGMDRLMAVRILVEAQRAILEQILQAHARAQAVARDLLARRPNGPGPADAGDGRG